MKKNILITLSIAALAFYGCKKSAQTETAIPVAVAFVNQETNLSVPENTVKLVFSNPTQKAGSIKLKVSAKNVIQGKDFSTSLAINNDYLEIAYPAGVNNASFTFKKITEAIEGETKNVKFSIESVSDASIQIPTLTAYTQLNFNESPILNNILNASCGGNTMPNQVYIDLSSGLTTSIPRTSWDLGFYGGNEFRVVINSAINKFAVKKLATTNIDEVQVEDAGVTVGNYDPIALAYIDQPDGNLSGTAIAEIAANDTENNVYLVNLGENIASNPAAGTSVALGGTARGWKKIRILKSGNDYKLQYANINETTHQEVIVSKNAAFNFSFFSFNNNKTVNVEPIKEKWDVCLTTFTNYTSMQGVNVSYFFPDVALTNSLNATRAYQVLTSEFAYENFSQANVNAANFETANAKDKRVIGATWRATFPLQLKTDRFYVLKDAAGNVYKLKFNAMQNAAGERGNVTIEYKKL
ncbi:MAG: HmuY family protein [Sphingobacteriaceae bacterium]|nr:HmuY family protein [Sphingobacteriaceae bacterium]